MEPLLAIAELAGDDMAERARAAALELSGDRTGEDDSLGVQLLRDIRSVFAERDMDRISSVTLAADLADMEGAPWAEWKGKPLTPNTLARLLRRYRISPMTVRLDDGTTAKGYKRADFEDDWSRYVPETGFQNVTPSQPSNQAENSHFQTVTSEDTKSKTSQGFPAWTKGCDGVTVEDVTEVLRRAYRAGHLTRTEWLERLELHHGLRRLNRPDGRTLEDELPDLIAGGPARRGGGRHSRWQRRRGNQLLPGEAGRSAGQRAARPRHGDARELHRAVEAGQL